MFIREPRPLESVSEDEVIEFGDLLEKITEDEEASIVHPVCAVLFVKIAVFTHNNGASADRSGSWGRILIESDDLRIGNTIEVTETEVKILQCEKTERQKRKKGKSLTVHAPTDLQGEHPHGQK